MSFIRAPAGCVQFSVSRANCPQGMLFMKLTEIRISLCPDLRSRLKSFCSLTFDDTFVIRDVKLIEGSDGLFLAMPSRKLADHCPRCHEKNHLRARFCNACGTRLDDNRHQRNQQINHNGANGYSGTTRAKLHADIAHPINAHCRHTIETQVFRAYQEELERSKRPGYTPTCLDVLETDFYDTSMVAAAAPGVGMPSVGPLQ
jgi:stage V sporulation protein G